MVRDDLTFCFEIISFKSHLNAFLLVRLCYRKMFRVSLRELYGVEPVPMIVGSFMTLKRSDRRICKLTEGRETIQRSGWSLPLKIHSNKSFGFIKWPRVSEILIKSFGKKSVFFKVEAHCLFHRKKLHLEQGGIQIPEEKNLNTGLNWNVIVVLAWNWQPVMSSSIDEIAPLAPLICSLECQRERECASSKRL